MEYASRQSNALGHTARPWFCSPSIAQIAEWIVCRAVEYKSNGWGPGDTEWLRESVTVRRDFGGFCHCSAHSECTGEVCCLAREGWVAEAISHWNFHVMQLHLQTS